MQVPRSLAGGAEEGTGPEDRQKTELTYDTSTSTSTKMGLMPLPTRMRNNGAIHSFIQTTARPCILLSMPLNTQLACPSTPLVALKLYKGR